MIHCKAGKGRTGCVICCYLLYSGEWSSCGEAMSFYAAMRRYNKKVYSPPVLLGVSISYLAYWTCRYLTSHICVGCDDGMSIHRVSQGVTIPSQIRYIGYFERFLKLGSEMPPKPNLRLQRIVLHGIPTVSKGGGT